MSPMTATDGQGASMTPRPLDRLLRQISDTEPEEISCSECFELLAGGVERELAGAATTAVQARLATGTVLALRGVVGDFLWVETSQRIAGYLPRSTPVSWGTE